MTVLNISLGGNFLLRYISKFLADILPGRFKRLLFVASAMGLILKGRAPEDVVLQRINARLRLCYGYAAMLFPIVIGRLLWRDYVTSKVKLGESVVFVTDLNVSELKEMQRWQLGLSMARRAPSYLRYGSVELMTTDLHDMLATLAEA